MSTTKHTAEPWTHTKLCGQASGPHAETCIGIIGKDGVAVAWISLNPSQGDKIEDGFADAGRIVSAVNACAGMEDPAAQIKEAREILSGLVNHCIRHGRQVMLPQIQDALRALGG